jgi:hypothetical protein
MLKKKMRKGGLEPEEALEMIELFSSQCCTVLHGMAPHGPRGPCAAAAAQSLALSLVRSRVSKAAVNRRGGDEARCFALALAVSAQNLNSCTGIMRTFSHSALKS